MQAAGATIHYRAHDAGAGAGCRHLWPRCTQQSCSGVGSNLCPIWHFTRQHSSAPSMASKCGSRMCLCLEASSGQAAETGLALQTHACLVCPPAACAAKMMLGTCKMVRLLHARPNAALPATSTHQHHKLHLPCCAASTNVFLGCWSSRGFVSGRCGACGVWAQGTGRRECQTDADFWECAFN